MDAPRRSRHRRRATASLVALTVTISLATPALAAPGELDASFGSDGKVTAVFPGGSFATAVAIQADGKIVAVGAAAGPSETGEFAVARFTPEGDPDPTFGDGGMLTTPIAGGGDEARSVAIQANGRIVVAGTDSRQRFALVRYRANGVLDPTFGGNGIVRTNLTPGDDIAYDVAIQQDGKIVAVGSAGSNPPRFALARYRRNGTLDPSFGDGGAVLSGPGWGTARAVVLQPNGRIVAAGHDMWGLRLARYRADGNPDRSFDGDGVVRKVISQIFPLAVALQTDGRIVVGGDYDIFGIGLARFTTHGQLDASFGGDGVVHRRVGQGEQAIDGLVIQADGRIVAAGSAGPHEFGDDIVWRFVLARFRRNGSLDAGWGGDGKVVTHFAGGAYAYGMAAQADGRVVVVGGSGASNIGAFALARYLTQGDA